MNTTRYFAKDCPPHRTMLAWIFRDHLDIQPYVYKNMEISPRYKPILGKLKLHKRYFDPIVNQLDSLFSALGWIGFADLAAGSEKLRRSESYGGLGLTCNPDFFDDTPPLAQVLGAGRVNLPKDFFAGEEGRDFFQYLVRKRADKRFFYFMLNQPVPKVVQWIKKLEINPKTRERAIALIEKRSGVSPTLLKNTYSDSYSFTQKTPAGNWPGIAELLDAIPMRLVRSRICEMRSHKLNRKNLEFFWHRDDFPTREFRILVCLKATHSGFGIEFKHRRRHYLKEGDVLFWDTSKPHRAFCDRFDQGSRICLVLGFSPWFDYDSKKACWSPNSHFGKVHPFDRIPELIERGILTDNSQ